MEKHSGEVGRPHDQLVGCVGLEVVKVDKLSGRVENRVDNVVAGLDWIVNNLQLELELHQVLGQRPVHQHSVGLDDVHLHTQWIFSLSTL